MRTRNKLSAFGLLAVQAFSGSALADAFDRSHTRLSVTLGSGSAFGQQYTVIGGGIDYMLTDLVQVGIDAQFWRSAEPAITKISPSLGIVLRGDGIRPYAGVFYRNTRIEGLEDLDSVGGRAGIWLSQGRGVSFGVGYVYERYLDCDIATFTDCDDSYPEISLTFAIGG